MPHDVTVAPQSASPSASATQAPPIPIRAEPLPSATTEPPRAAPPLKMSEIAPTQGDLNTLLAAEWKKASGLGLTTCRELLVKAGGAIRVDDATAPGEGAAFVLDVPAEAAAEAVAVA